VICSGKYLKDKNTQHLRDKRNELPRIKNGGWHFSYLGGVNAIKQKLKSFSHTEFNKEEFLDEQQILNSLEKGQDVLKRKNVKYRFVPLRKYPHRIRVIMKQYPQFLKELPFHKRVMNFFRF
jgi:beta-1,4-mannosyl-glycoprotein beta-1,4-N-acetylglucosaminyltransferase